MATTKYETTKKEMFTQVISIIEQSNATNKNELIERINHEIELATKKSNTKSAEQLAIDKAIKDNILATLTKHSRPMTISEIQTDNKALSVAEGVSSSKAVAMVKQLINDGKVVRTVEKKKAYFSIA